VAGTCPAWDRWRACLRCAVCGGLLARRDLCPLPAGAARSDADGMKGWFAHHRAAADLGRLDEELAGLGGPLTVADRACCCPARPVVRVIMPPGPGRPGPVDLLLCGHHYRVSRAALRAAGAIVYDEAGLLITDRDVAYPAASRPSAAAADRSQGLGRPWQLPSPGLWRPSCRPGGCSRLVRPAGGWPGVKG
jgi:hypothetical protein